MMLHRALFNTARASAALTAALAVATVAPSRARAHFELRAPACYSRQDALGSPQKSAPCGQADPGSAVVPTGAVTAYVEGGMITVTINETVYHPGHYRVAIARDMAGLPADPMVTAGSTACGTAAIDRTPTLPLLGDGLLVHTAPFSGPQTVRVPLPAGFTCDHCVLQVVEFMSNHGLNPVGGCFYHHCATVSVMPPGADGGTSDASTTPDASGMPDASETPDASTTPDVATTQDTSAPPDSASPGMDGGADGSTGMPMTHGCSCRTATGGTGSRAQLAGLFALGALVVARRRRRSTG